MDARPQAIEVRLESLSLGDYDPTLPLVIDPVVLVYCGYFGGAVYEYGTAIAIDAAGNTYPTGSTASIQESSPVMIGPDLTFNGTNDAFVAGGAP